MDRFEINRRQLAGLALVAGAGTVAAAAAPSAPLLEEVFQAEVTLGTPVDLGEFADGRRRFVPITGGTVSGPRFSGKVLGGGGDWQTIGADGVTLIHARYAIQAADGTAIGIDNPGVRVATPDIIARLTAGEDLDPSLYYFRTTPSFEVRRGPHDWLRKSVFVGVGIRHPATVVLRVYRVG